MFSTKNICLLLSMALHPNNWYVATGQSAPENFNIEVVVSALLLHSEAVAFTLTFSSI